VRRKVPQFLPGGGVVPNNRLCTDRCWRKAAVDVRRTLDIGTIDRYKDEIGGCSKLLNLLALMLLTDNPFLGTIPLKSFVTSIT